MINDEQSDFTFSAFSSSSSDSGIVNSGFTAMILQSQHIDMVRDLVLSSRSVSTAESGGSLSICGEGRCGDFDKVFVSDNVRENIISVSKLCDRGNDILFTKDSVKLLRSDSNMVVAVGSRVGGLYRIPLDDVLAVRTQLVEGVSLPRSCFTKKGRTKFKCLCDICARAKIARISFPRVRDRLIGIGVGDYIS